MYFNIKYIISFFLSILTFVNVYDLNTRPPDLSMFFDESQYFQLIYPEEVAYIYKIRQAKDFGTNLDSHYTGIELVVGEPYDGCSALRNNYFVKGSIVLVERGGCSFLSKAHIAEKAKAKAVIIADNDKNNDQKFVDMIKDDTNRQVNIPTFFLLGKDGFMIKKSLEKWQVMHALINIPVNVSSVPLKKLNLPPWTFW